MKKIKLKIKGMHCTSCAINIDGDLEDFVEGVKSSNTNYAKQETEVEYDDKQVKIDQIIGKIKETGYQAELLN